MFTRFKPTTLFSLVAIAAVSIITSCSNSQELNLVLKGWDTNSPECSFPEPTRDIGDGSFDKFLKIPNGAPLDKVTQVLGNPDDIRTLTSVQTLSWTNKKTTPVIVLVGYFNKDKTLSGKEIILNNSNEKGVKKRNCSWRVANESD